MQPFERKRVITDAVDKAIVLFRSGAVKRGDHVPWSLLAEAGAIETDSPHWPAFLARFRKRVLREFGIALFHFGHRDDGGLRAATVDETLKLIPDRRTKKAVRQFTRLKRELTALPDRELSDRQRQAKHLKAQEAARGRRKALEARRRDRAIGAPSGRRRNASAPDLA